MKKMSFTRVEMLMVIAVSAVLGSLIIGAASAVNDPKVTACADVMRSIEQKTTQFEKDNGGTLMSALKNGKTWGSQLVTGKYFTKFHNNRNMPQGFSCPAETRTRSIGKRVYEHPSVNHVSTYDYGLNWFTHAKLTGDNSNIARAAVKRPAKLIRMTEGTKFALFATPESVTDRHGEDVGNVVFEDGHIEFMTIPYKDSENYNSTYWNN